MENSEDLLAHAGIEEDYEGTYTGKKIFPAPSDTPVKTLYDSYKDGSLILQPEFQRYYVWDIKKATQLIESALLDIPIPTIYTSEDASGNEIVIDGQQRLSSFFSFIDGRFADGRIFKLTGLNALTQLEGKSYGELETFNQKKIQKHPMRKIMFKKESDPGLKYEIFRRLNSGAVQLNHQELRNCVFRGRYNDLLKELAKNKDYLKLLGRDKPHSRMIDVELILRFAAFYHSTYMNYDPPMKIFLDKDMDTFKDITNDRAKDLENDFKKAVSIAMSMFGENAFKRFTAGNENERNGEWGKTFNASLFDIVMFAFSKNEKNTLMRNLDRIKESLLFLMTEDQEFISAIEISTSSKKAVKTRFEKFRKEIDDIIGRDSAQPRLFTKEVKEALYRQDKTCKLCGNEIASIDDAHVDHIEPYWKGGQTIPENARLLHRYCNVSRPRNDS
jgi:hypothetical protein